MFIIYRGVGGANIGGNYRSLHIYIFSEGDKLVPSVQKKINELEVGLLHLQQNIDIPEISLPIHPAIQQLVDSKKKPTVEDLGTSVSDSTFLNALQKDVSRWIREIQKVCVPN